MGILILYANIKKTVAAHVQCCAIFFSFERYTSQRYASSCCIDLPLDIVGSTL